MSNNEIDEAISRSQFLKYAEDLAEIYGLERQRRQELHDAYEGISDLVHAMRDGVLVTDSELIVKEANVPACNTLNLRFEKILRQPLNMVLGNAVTSARIKQLTQNTDGSDAPSSLEFETSSGNVIRITATCMKNGWWFFLFHDVTNEARAANLKSDFLAMLSHELRTPLTGILGFTDILMETHPAEESPDDHEALQYIRESGIRMLKTVEELLHFAALQSDRVEMRSEPLRIPQLVHNVFDSLSRQAQQHDIALYLDHDSTNPVVLLGNPDMLFDLLYQLIQNGILFGNKGGSVTVHIRTTNGNAVLEIEDNGIGIPAGERAKVFDSFYQVEECLSRNRDGMGLGLSLSRLIAEIHGGSIALESELGEGTTVTVTLPVSSQSQTERTLRRSGPSGEGYA